MAPLTSSQKEHQSLGHPKKSTAPIPGYKHGHITRVPVGTLFNSRSACSESGVHRAPCQGIFHRYGSAYAICLNGEYENDIDNGLTISYTGAGGRINLFGKQKEVCMNQDWKSAPNRALLHAYRDRKPIRVIRGFKLNGAYAPKQGYRYDGLYRIYKVYTKVTNDSKKHRLCMYELQVCHQHPW
ncbi:PUA-like domain-containing protein [Lentinula detonsa]|uniref:PUA-like domain-containing protein n=1 Tax=Lentinula detonsa TaxID=2804962 RepID=A0A9W8P9Z8_9AGAR|nr:PUA-like domain-containing protein [Lentinula detonsa]